MNDWTDRLINVAMAALMFAVAGGIILVFCSLVFAHEHQPGETAEQQRIVDFYASWHRPKGDYQIEHRRPLCCYGTGARQDCFPVLARRVSTDGKEELMPDVSGLPTTVQAEYGYKWYPNNYHVTEDQQIDPRESPDGRSHMCILGNTVVCYVRGWGE